MKIIKLVRMNYESPTKDSRGRHTYSWREGFLAKGPNGQDLYPPASWAEALEVTRTHYPKARILKGD